VSAFYNIVPENAEEYCEKINDTHSPSKLLVAKKKDKVKRKRLGFNEVPLK
jgi:hypothetical protein